MKTSPIVKRGRLAEFCPRVVVVRRGQLPPRANYCQPGAMLVVCQGIEDDLHPFVYASVKSGTHSPWWHQITPQDLTPAQRYALLRAREDAPALEGWLLT